MKDSTAKVTAQVPVDVATFLLNEKRQDVTGIEVRQDVAIVLIPNQNLETPHFEVQRVRTQDLPNTTPGDSYNMVSEVESPTINFSRDEKPVSAQPAVRDIARTMPKPKPAGAAGGFLSRFFRGLFGADDSSRSRGSGAAENKASDAQRGKRGTSDGDSRANENTRRSRSDGNRRNQPNRDGGNERKRGSGARRGRGGADKPAAANNEDASAAADNRPAANSGGRRPRRERSRNQDNRGSATAAETIPAVTGAIAPGAIQDDVAAPSEPGPPAPMAPAVANSVIRDDDPTERNPAQIPEHVQVITPPDPEKFRTELDQIVHEKAPLSPPSSAPVVEQQALAEPAALPNGNVQEPVQSTDPGPRALPNGNVQEPVQSADPGPRTLPSGNVQEPVQSVEPGRD